LSTEAVAALGAAGGGIELEIIVLAAEPAEGVDGAALCEAISGF